MVAPLYTAFGGVAAVDITTTPPYHHSLAVEALERGMHAMVEKPVGLTVKGSNRIRAAQEASGRVVSVAENYRRDPINRLGKALLDSGVIGTPRVMIHHTIERDWHRLMHFPNQHLSLGT